MRINFLSIIACFLFVSVTISSCLDSDDTYVASSDATVHAFELDTIHGKQYNFTIDQLQKRIYNVDSLPVGADTIVDSIRIKTFQVTGYVTSHAEGSLTDTILNINNAQDLRGAINTQKGLSFDVHAADGSTFRTYTLELRVHKQDPDSMSWTQMSKNGLPEQALSGKYRILTLGDELLLYTVDSKNQLTLYKNSTRHFNAWRPTAITGINANELPNFVQVIQPQYPSKKLQKVLYTFINNKVYQSADGNQWKEVSSLKVPSGWTAEMMISNYNNTIIALFSQNGKRYLVPTDSHNQIWLTQQATLLPQGFPTENIYTAEYKTINKLTQIMVVGAVDAKTEKIIPWAYDGRNWMQMNPNSSYNSYCLTEKIGHQPAIMFYDKRFYMLGEQLNFVYSSQNGLAWFQAAPKIFLPKELSQRGNYSMSVDADNFIWIITGSKDQHNPEVWRGRLNKLGFKN